MQRLALAGIAAAGQRSRMNSAPPAASLSSVVRLPPTKVGGHLSSRLLCFVSRSGPPKGAFVHG
jgi:hypothetical protein